MFRGIEVAVVVPAFNEASLIVRAVQQVPVYVDHVVVVDDGSTDGTASVLQRQVERKGLVLVQNRTNRGVGRAIVTGYQRALELGAKAVAVMAGDAQMDPRDLDNLLAPLVEGRADYVKGDRLAWPGAFQLMPLTRFFGNHLLSWITRRAIGLPDLRDSQCGYTAASARILGELDLDSLYPSYGFPNDILAQLAACKARLVQVPVRPIYGDEISGITWRTALFRMPAVIFSAARRNKRSAARLRAPLFELARPKG